MSLIKLTASTTSHHQDKKRAQAKAKAVRDKVKKDEERERARQAEESIVEDTQKVCYFIILNLTAADTSCSP